jgi:hypothetical protein
MKKLLQRLLPIGVSLIPVIANAHSGHGLVGEEHYHLPVELAVLGALIVAVLLVLGLKRFIDSSK